MKTYAIAVLPGDGIGPEVIAQAVRVLEAVGERFDLRFALETFPVGAAAVAVAKHPLPPETRAAVLRSDAVLLGAVGDPALDGAPRELRPETGLLALRKLLNVFVNPISSPNLSTQNSQQNSIVNWKNHCSSQAIVSRHGHRILRVIIHSFSPSKHAIFSFSQHRSDIRDV